MNEIEKLKNEGWFPILKTGKFRDSKGREHIFDLQYLEDVEKSYKRGNAEFKEAPMITGHLEGSTPARGWIDELKTVGTFLLAKAKEIPADFIDRLKNKEFKFISPSLRQNRSLRHCAWVPVPAIPGLGEFPVDAYANFAEKMGDDDILLCFDFAEIDIFTVGEKFKSIGSILQKIKELFASVTSFQDADSAINTGTIDFIANFPITNEQNNNFNENKSGIELKLGKEETLDKDKTPVKEKQEQEASADFAEKYSAEKNRADNEKQRADQAETRLKELEKGKREKDAADFCESLPPGTIIPKFMPGMKVLMARLDTDGESYDFTEGGEKETPGAFLKRFLKSLKPQIPLDPLPIGSQKDDDAEFSEHVDPADVELNRKAKAIQNAKKITYEAALKEAAGGK